MHPKEILEGGSAEEGGCLGAQKMHGLSFVRRQKLRVNSVLLVQHKRNKDQENKDPVFSRSFFSGGGGKGARRESCDNPRNQIAKVSRISRYAFLPSSSESSHLFFVELDA